MLDGQELPLIAALPVLLLIIVIGFLIKRAKRTSPWDFLSEVLNSSDVYESLLQATKKTRVEEIIPYWLCTDKGRQAIEKAIKNKKISIANHQRFLVSSSLAPPNLHQLETIEIGSVIEMDSEILHPITGEPMKTITLRKIFNSAAKPKLYAPDHGPMLIWKVGDNLFSDLAVMFFADYLNNLWKKNAVNIKMEKYGIFPCGNDRGFIECVSDVCTIREYQFDDFVCTEEFLASMAGASLVGWVLGIRDRHQDNQLIVSTPNGKLLLPIDFGFLFNTGPKIDAPRISVPNRLVQKMTEQKVRKVFVKLCVRGFELIWDNKAELNRLGAYLFPENFSAYFNSPDTYLCLNKEAASEAFETKLKKRLVEGKSLKHWIKDIAHNSKISFNSKLSQ